MKSLGWFLIQYDRCPYKGKFGHRDRLEGKGRQQDETQGEDSHLLAKDPLRLLEARRETWNRSFSSTFRGTMAMLTP